MSTRTEWGIGLTWNQGQLVDATLANPMIEWLGSRMGWRQVNPSEWRIRAPRYVAVQMTESWAKVTAKAWNDNAMLRLYATAEALPLWVLEE